MNGEDGSRQEERERGRPDTGTLMVKGGQEASVAPAERRVAVRERSGRTVA